VTSIFFIIHFILDFSQLSKENHDIELSKVFAKIDKIVSPKELKKVKQEKALIDSLRSENTMLFNIIDTLENKLKESEDLLKKFSRYNLKSMLCIHSDISNKPASIVDDMSTYTSQLLILK
jgi:cell division protein FtsB